MPKTTQKDIDRMMKILEDNSKLDFVQRILNPEKYPNINSKEDKRLKKGQFATHQMSSNENEDGTEFYAYPEIVNDNGKLHWFDDRKDAAGYAEETGQRIKFKSRKDSEWFAENYKMIWPLDFRQKKD